MQIKRAIRLSFLLYFSSLIVGIITALIYGLDFETAEAAPDTVWYIGLVTSAILMALFTHWYFKSPKAKASMKHGLYFGLVSVGVSFLIEFVLIVPYILTTDSPASPFEYYTNPLFWFSIAVVILTATLVGKYDLDA